jgi:hypothetical protein
LFFASITGGGELCLFTSHQALWASSNFSLLICKLQILIILSLIISTQRGCMCMQTVIVITAETQSAPCMQDIVHALFCSPDQIF